MNSTCTRNVISISFGRPFDISKVAMPFIVYYFFGIRYAFSGLAM